MPATGHFAQAADLQQETMEAYARAGVFAGHSFLEKNLALYRQGKRPREAWAADDPLFYPRNPAVRPAK
jgi:hypothetical protein